MDQTRKKVVESLTFRLNTAKPSKIKAIKEKSPE